MTTLTTIEMIEQIELLSLAIKQKERIAERERNKIRNRIARRVLVTLKRYDNRMDLTKLSRFGPPAYRRATPEERRILIDHMEQKKQIRIEYVEGTLKPITFIIRIVEE